VAKRVGVSRVLIYEVAKAGRVKALAIGKKPSIRIHVDEPARREEEQGYYDYER
jgi:hypothetical protein